MRRAVGVSGMLAGAVVAAVLSTMAAHAESATPLTQDVGALLESGLAAYAQGIDGESRDARLEGFRRAELLFREAAESGSPSAALYTNLGNAALQAEHLGAAVLAYRRALLLDPGRTQTTQNLIYARKQLPQWLPIPIRGDGALDSFFFWRRSLTYSDRALLASGFFLLTALLAAPAIVRRSTALRNIALLPAMAWGLLVFSLIFDPADSAVPEGVVVADEVPARAADSINAPLRFAEPLPSGTELRILEERGEWLQIGLHNGRSAWVAASSVARISAAAR